MQVGTPGANNHFFNNDSLLSLKHRIPSLKGSSQAMNEFDPTKSVSPLKFKPSNKAAGEDPLLD